MSNYPVGAENDSNAPFNKKELQGENVGLFDYILENCEMNTDATCSLIEFDLDRINAVKSLKEICDNIIMYNELDIKKELFKIIKLISEPQIFIENE